MNVNHPQGELDDKILNAFTAFCEQSGSELANIDIHHSNGITNEGNTVVEIIKVSCTVWRKTEWAKLEVVK